MKHKTAFFTVVYPGIENYFKDFAYSLQQQTNKMFDLIIFNENNTEIDFELLLSGISYKIISTEPATPIIIRERGFSYLRKEQYKYVVFGDADDWFSENRVEVCTEYLQEFDFVINDVDIVTDTEQLITRYFSKRLENKSLITMSMVEEGNFMGLSASAIRLEALPTFTTPEGVVALDWYMFSRMLLDGAKACFINEALTYYRQYDTNLVGMKEMTLASLKREVAVKLGHYSALSAHSDVFMKLYKQFVDLSVLVSSDKELNVLYSKIEKLNLDFPFWWEKTKNGQL